MHGPVLPGDRATKAKVSPGLLFGGYPPRRGRLQARVSRSCDRSQDSGGYPPDLHTGSVCTGAVVKGPRGRDTPQQEGATGTKDMPPWVATQSRRPAVGASGGRAAHPRWTAVAAAQVERPRVEAALAFLRRVIREVGARISLGTAHESGAVERKAAVHPEPEDEVDAQGDQDA